MIDGLFPHLLSLLTEHIPELQVKKKEEKQSTVQGFMSLPHKDG
jgi:hypothetical protein